MSNIRELLGALLPLQEMSRRQSIRYASPCAYGFLVDGLSQRDNMNYVVYHTSKIRYITCEYLTVSHRIYATKFITFMIGLFEWYNYAVNRGFFALTGPLCTYLEIWFVLIYFSRSACLDFCMVGKSYLLCDKIIGNVCCVITSLGFLADLKSIMQTNISSGSAKFYTNFWFGDVFHTCATLHSFVWL